MDSNINYDNNNNVLIEPSIGNTRKIILILGEGNFSFTYSLIKNNIYNDYFIFATDITDTFANRSNYLQQLKESDCFKNKTLFIEFGVDVFKLDDDGWNRIFSKFLPNETFRKPDIIQFNFPWTIYLDDRFIIKDTNELVVQILRSANELLNIGGQLKLALCPENNPFFDRYKFEDAKKNFQELEYKRPTSTDQTFMVKYPEYQHCSVTGNHIPGLEPSKEHIFVKIRNII